MAALLGRCRAVGTVDGRADRVTLAIRLAGVVAAAGVVCALVFGVMWWLAAHGPAARTAAAREDALVAARQIAINLQTLDYATVEHGLDLWQDSATGPLLEEFRKGRADYIARMRQVQTSSTARIVDVALSDLDVAAGRARAVVSADVKITQTVNGTASLPASRQVRIQLELVRVPDLGWKASAASALRS